MCDVSKENNYIKNRGKIWTHSVQVTLTISPVDRAKIEQNRSDKMKILGKNINKFRKDQAELNIIFSLLSTTFRPSALFTM